jgi:DNA-binding transcriptional MerR regulator
LDQPQQILFDFTAPPPPPPVKEIKEEATAKADPPQPKKRGRPKNDPSLKVKKVPGKRGRKSLKEASAIADLVEIPEDEILFQKKYYTTTEVANMFHVTQSQIRLWESKFSILQPKKNAKGDRYFRPIDVKNLYLIHDLLRHRKYTVDGAKDYLKKNAQINDRFEIVQGLQKVKSFLLEIKANLD